MVAWVKHQGIWKEADNILVKKSGKWTESQSVQRKDAGVWTTAHNNVVAPISTPELNLEHISGTSGSREWRFLRVGARLTEATDNPDCTYIQVLARKDGYPANPYAQGYYSEKIVVSEPNAWVVVDEPWSRFGFHTQEVFHSTAQEKARTFPPNASTAGGDILPGGQWWYFAAWAKDKRGNWGPGVSRKIWIRRDFTDPGGTNRAGRFIPSEILCNHSVYTGGTPWTASNLDVGIQLANGADTETYFFYGNEIVDRIGSRGTPTVISASLYLQRSAEAVGPSGDANVYLGIHHAAQSSPDYLRTYTNWGKIGTLLPGQAKWFNLDANIQAELTKNNSRGFVLHVPGFGPHPVEDQLRLTKPELSPSQGELHVEWNEVS